MPPPAYTDARQLYVPAPAARDSEPADARPYDIGDAPEVSRAPMPDPTTPGVGTQDGDAVAETGGAYPYPSDAYETNTYGTDVYRTDVYGTDIYGTDIYRTNTYDTQTYLYNEQWFDRYAFGYGYGRFYPGHRYDDHLLYRRYNGRYSSDRDDRRGDVHLPERDRGRDAGDRVDRTPRESPRIDDARRDAVRRPVRDARQTVDARRVDIDRAQADRAVRSARSADRPANDRPANDRPANDRSANDRSHDAHQPVRDARQTVGRSHDDAPRDSGHSSSRNDAPREGPTKRR